MISILVYNEKQLNILIMERSDPLGRSLCYKPQHMMVLQVEKQSKTMQALIYVYVPKVQLSHIFASDIMCLNHRVVRHLMHIVLNKHKDL